MSVGFLVYDLQEFAADCLSRVADRLPLEMKAYPIFDRVANDKVRFAYRPSRLTGRFFAIHKQGSTPEGFTSSINWRAALMCVRENKIVVLFGIQAGTALLAAFLSTIAGRALVSVNQTLPPEWEHKRRWWVRWLKRWVLKRCRVHIIQTPITRRTLTEVYGLDPATFVVAPFESGVAVFKSLISEVKEGREELRQKRGWGKEECIFLFVGTLLQFKGVETILEAVKRLMPSEVPFRVVLAGPDAVQAGQPSIKDYGNLASRLGVDQSVHFLGKMSLADLAGLYLAADVLLLPTQKDCWPKVLAEGALAGLPLVTSSACGAAGSLVEDDKTGIVIPPADPEALALSMKALFDPALRCRLGAQSQRFVSTFCDPDEEVRGYVKGILLAARTLDPSYDAEVKMGAGQ